VVEEKLILELRELKQIIAESLLCSKVILNLDEASKYLGISRSTLYKINLTCGIPFSKPANKLIYYKRVDLETWMLQNSTNSISNDVKVKPRKRRGTSIT
jgi:predicted DNA-binding transcriptional regulator AlpA